MLQDQLGDWLEWQRRESMRWLYFMAGAIMVMLVVSFLVKPVIPEQGEHTGYPAEVQVIGDTDPDSFMYREEARYPLEYVPGFWCVFGLAGYFSMILVIRKCIQPLLFRREEVRRD